MFYALYRYVHNYISLYYCDLCMTARWQVTTHTTLPTHPPHSTHITLPRHPPHHTNHTNLHKHLKHPTHTPQPLHTTHPTTSTYPPHPSHPTHLPHPTHHTHPTPPHYTHATRLPASHYLSSHYTQLPIIIRDLFSGNVYCYEESANCDVLCAVVGVDVA